MRLERTLVQGLVQYRLLDEDGNEVEEVFIPASDEDERDMWLAGYIRLAEKYDEEIEGLKPEEPLWVLHPEGSPVSKVFSYCRNCGRQFSAEQITAAIKKADKTRGPLGDEELAKLSLFCPAYDPDSGCGRGTEGVPQWRFGSR